MADDGPAISPQEATVTLVASWGPSLINFRGPLITELLAQGKRVVAAAPEVEGTPTSTLQQIGAEVVALGLERRSLFSFGDVRALLQLRRLLIAQSPEDVAVPYTLKPILLTGLAHRSLRRRARLIPMFTGLGFLVEQEETFVGRMVRGLMRHALRRSRAAIVQHEADRAWLRRHRIVAPGTPIHIVSGSGVDMHRFAHRPLELSAVPTVLYLGRMVPEKGIAAFCGLAAAADFDARWVAVGPFEDQRTGEALMARFAEVGIEYRGMTTDVRPYLAAARVVVLLTTYGEGIPRVLQEAMSVGRPVVASDIPGCRSAVTDGREGFLVDPSDTGRARELIRRLCEDAELARSIGQAGHRRAADAFEAGAVARQTYLALFS